MPQRRAWSRVGLVALALSLALVAPTAALGGTAADGREGQSFAGTSVPASTGCGGPPAPTIDWVDGGPLTPAVCVHTPGGLDTVSTGSHTYEEEGSYAAVAHYTGPNGAHTTPFGLVIDDAAVTATGRTASATPGAAFSGTVSHFVDADQHGNVGDYSVTIDWGDGTTSPGTTSAAGDGFDVAGPHTYAAPGTYTVHTAIADKGGASASASSTVTVAAPGAPLQPGPSPPPAPTAGPPAAQAAFTTAPAPSGHVALDASASRPAGAVVSSYAWNLDGHTGPQPSALCGADASQLSARLPVGDHTLTLSVTAPGGQVTTIAHQVTVPRVAGTASHRDAVPAGSARAAAKAASTQVFVCSPGPSDHPGDVTGQGGPPAGCATQVQFGLADAVGCLHPIATHGDWPKAENKIFEHMLAFVSCNGPCAVTSAAHLTLPQFQAGVIAKQDPFFSTQPVRINGIDFYPHPGAAIVLLPDQNMVISSNAQMKVAGIPIQDGPVTLYVPKGSGTVHIDDYTLSEQAKRIGLGSFPFDGSIGLDFAYHRAQLPVHVTLPNAFTAGEGDPIEGAVTLSTDNAQSLSLDAVHVSVPDAFLGPMEIQNLFFDYQREGNAWSGGADIIFPEISLKASPPPPDQGFGIRDGHLDHLGATLEFNPPLDLFPGVGVTHIGFTVGFDPTRFSGSVGLNALDVVDIDGTLLGAFASPGAPYTIRPGDGAGLDPLVGRRLTSTSFAVGGDTSIITPAGRIGLGSGYLLYEYPDYAEFGGSFFYGFHDIFSIDGHINGFVQVSQKRFNIEAGLHACVAVLGCTGVDAAISSNGIAACWSQPILFTHIRIGVGYHWGDSLPDIYLLGCDVGPYTAHAARATAAQASGARSVTLAAGLPFANIRVRGADDAPRVTLTGPNGERVVTPDTADVFADGRFALLRQSQSRTTFIGVRHPAAGTWTVTPQPGSASVTDVASAEGLPAPVIRGHVTGAGSVRTLRYRATPEPGQQVSFVERGAGTWRVIGRATGASGVLRFSPAAGPAGGRQIVALVSHSGLPSRQIAVTAFHAAAPPRPGRPAGVSIARHGHAVTIRWGPSARAARYVVAVALSDGRRRVFLVRGRRVNVAGVPVTSSVVVRVAGLDATNHHGDVATARRARLHTRRAAPVPRLHI